uniref:RRM domain-containing protein n=1 Tax=Glycine max TaxID=3847 RepID=K7M684_SOYBN
MVRERNTGEGRDRFRGKEHQSASDRHRVATRREYTGNIGKASQHNAPSNWRDNHEITSFYFTRFGDDITEKDLWYHFKKWGDVREVFIAKRRNKTGRRYGFVRFKGLRDAQYTAKQLDKVVIGGLKLFVNIPKYEREQLRRNEDGGGRQQSHQEKFSSVDDRARYAHQSNPTSYLDALTRNIWVPKRQTVVNTHDNNCGSSFSLVHIEIGKEDSKWLENAWVGSLQNPTLFEKVEDELWWLTGLDLKPSYIGDDKVLLHGIKDEVAKQVMNAVSEGGSPLFQSLEKWNSKVRVESRLTWVYVWGVPIQVWSPKYFRQIMAAVGEFVDMDDEAEDRRRLDRARLLIKTSRAPNIQHTIDVVMEEETFKVYVVEECGGGWCKRCGSIRSVGGSSEDIDSDDSFDDRATAISERMNTVEASPSQSERLPENLPLEDHRVIALPSGHKDQEDPLDNADYWQSLGAFAHQLGGSKLGLPQKASTVTDKGPGAADSRRHQGRGPPNKVIGSQNFHDNGNGERGEGQGVSSKGEGSNGFLNEDTWTPRGGNSTFFQISEFKEGGSLAGQIGGADKGPNQDMGHSFVNKQLMQHTPLESDGSMGLKSQNNKALTESSWMVYSRKRRGKKQAFEGHHVPIPMTDIIGPNPMTLCTQDGVRHGELQCTQEGAQQKELDFAEVTQGNDINHNNGEVGTNTEPLNQQYQEALNIWSKAKQLGVSGMEEQQVIIDQLMKMEERDGSEAEKRGVSTNF